MKEYFNQIIEQISVETSTIDIDGCDISTDEAFRMVEFLKSALSKLRSFFLSKESMNAQDEIVFFKEMKPEILGMLLYFNKIHNIVENPVQIDPFCQV